MTIDSTVKIVIVIIKPEDLEHDCNEFQFLCLYDIYLENRVQLSSSEEGGHVVFGFVIIGTEFSQACNF